MSNKSLIAIALFIAMLIIVLNSVFIINQGRQAILLQFGQVVSKKVLRAGLHFKLPAIQNVLLFEDRVLSLNPDSKEVIASDQKRVIVDMYAKYRIIDPLVFYQSVGNENSLRLRLNPILESHMREEIGKTDLLCLLGDCRSKVMDNIHVAVNRQASFFGIEVVDVRIKRTDLPEANSKAIFGRMQTAREKEAREIRAQGREDADKIVADADKEQIVIVSEAEKQASIIRGRGDAAAAAIYTSSFAKDVDFFEFLRSMEMYKASLLSENTKFVISSGDEFMKLFNWSGGKEK